MNNPRSLFFLFLVLLSALAGVVTWWLGPNLVGILLDADERRSPYQVLVFDTSTEYATGFGVSAAAVPEAAQLEWRSSQPVVALGPSVPTWQRIELWRFASGADFVRFATAGQVRAAQSAAGRNRALYGFSLATQSADSASGSREATLPLNYPVLLAAGRDATLQQSLDQSAAPLLPAGAQVLWQRALLPLTGGPALDQFLLVSFSSVRERSEWLWNTETQVSLELSRKAFDRLSVWELGGLSR